ncbi:MAG: PD-(D/E)XK nuclease domain-containing protein, partial [Bacteroidaceae bacterium]
SGYLTIKDYNPQTRFYTLAYPNEEVRNGFLECLLPSYVYQSTETNTFYIVNFVQDMLRDDIESCLERTQAFFASIPNDLENKTEKHYQTVFYLLFRLMGQYIETEVKSAIGRADVVMKTATTIYVFEFKLDGTAEEALAQIESKGYAIPYAPDTRPVVKIGINFDTTTRTLGAWKIQ